MYKIKYLIICLFLNDFNFAIQENTRGINSERQVYFNDKQIENHFGHKPICKHKADCSYPKCSNQKTRSIRQLNLSIQSNAQFTSHTRLASQCTKRRPIVMDALYVKTAEARPILPKYKPSCSMTCAKFIQSDYSSPSSNEEDIAPSKDIHHISDDLSQRYNELDNDDDFILMNQDENVSENTTACLSQSNWNFDDDSDEFGDQILDGFPQIVIPSPVVYNAPIH